MQALGLLAGGVAHDLNNILSAVVLYPELLLRDESLTEKQRKYLKEIHLSGEKASVIVSDLLTFGRDAKTHQEVINLNDVIFEYLESIEFRTIFNEYSGIELRTVLDSKLHPIKGSPVHLSKIVMNIILNAIEAVETNGFVVISTSNHYLDTPLKGYDKVKPGEYVTLSVVDNGPGISLEDLGRIFEPFYSKKILGRCGSGLGLSIVWNTVHDHEGYIEVKTSEKGTEFKVYLPITGDSPVVRKETMSLRRFHGDGRMILVVDDEISQREISTEMLETLGYRVTAVSCGEEALAFLHNQEADLVILDMIIKTGKNGCGIYEDILKIHPKQKAIITSGYSETPEVRRAQQLGAGQFIRKPYSLETIAMAIHGELGLRN